MSKIEVDAIEPQSGTDLTIGASGDTITVPAGATFDSSAATNTLPSNVVTTTGTQTLTNKSIATTQLTGTITPSDSTVTLAKLTATGTQDATTFLRGDNTFASATPADNSITTAQLAYNPNAFRNIVINGDMNIAQRGTSASSLTGSGYNTVDRWNIVLSGLGTWTQSQSTDVPTGQGFATSLKMDCTTADASPAAGDFLFFNQRVEGQNVQYLKKGTSSAESTTLSFWVKSNKTGTYICELDDNDNTRNINKSYTISSANTWEKKTITYAGDTTGTFENNNGNSLQVIWWLGAGSTYSSGTLNNAWEGTTNANRAVGQVNLADSTSNEWYVTGVQLEAGTTASDFEFLPYDVNLSRCLRYFQKTDYNFLGFGFATATSQWLYHNVFYNTLMRAIPTASSNSNAVTGTSNTFGLSPKTMVCNVYAQSSGSNNDIYIAGAGAILTFNSEL